MRVAVVGASGLVGAALCERLASGASGAEVVACVNSPGNAWRLARDPRFAIRVVDLLDAETLDTALEGCTHLVNATRGDDKVMLEGFRNLLRSASRQRIGRLIHLSSVMVYGDPPVPESQSEDAPTRTVRNTYGWVKLAQDEMLQAACRQGLSAVSLCPPNITGPFSYFLLQLVDAIGAGALALVDNGARACETVDVRNLCRAIELALESGPTDGRRLFVTDDSAATWADVVEPIRALAAGRSDIPAIGEAELRARMAAESASIPRRSLWRAVKHLASSDVRTALSGDPLLNEADRFLRELVGRFGPGVEDRLRRSIEGPIRIQGATESPLNLRLCAQQLRGVRHSCAAATREIGYRPEISFDESGRDFVAWFRAMHGMDDIYGDLARALT